MEGRSFAAPAQVLLRPQGLLTTAAAESSSEPCVLTSPTLGNNYLCAELVCPTETPYRSPGLPTLILPGHSFSTVGALSKVPGAHSSPDQGASLQGGCRHLLHGVISPRTGGTGDDCLVVVDICWMELGSMSLFSDDTWCYLQQGPPTCCSSHVVPCFWS